MSLLLNAIQIKIDETGQLIVDRKFRYDINKNSWINRFTKKYTKDYKDNTNKLLPLLDSLEIVKENLIKCKNIRHI